MLFVLLRADVVNLVDVAIVGTPSGDWWHVLTAPFAYENSGYAFVALFAIALFGWLVERRHGPIVVVLPVPCRRRGRDGRRGRDRDVPDGARRQRRRAGAARARGRSPICSTLRRGREIDGDLLGAGVFAVVLLLLPVAVEWADPLAGIDRRRGRCGARLSARAPGRPLTRADGGGPPLRMIRRSGARLHRRGARCGARRAERGPGRLREAQRLVARAAPQLHRVLDEALAAGGWFGEAHEQAVAAAAGVEDPDERRQAVGTLVAEETRLGMLVGVAVGFELARTLDTTGTYDGRGLRWSCAFSATRPSS